MVGVCVSAPITVSITGSLYHPDGSLLTSPSEIQVKLNVPIQVPKVGGGVEWVSSSSVLFVVADTSALSLTLVPNKCDDCTISPANTFYKVSVRSTDETFRDFDQKWVVTCDTSASCASVDVSSVVFNDTLPNLTLNQTIKGLDDGVLQGTASTFDFTDNLAAIVLGDTATISGTTGGGGDGKGSGSGFSDIDIFALGTTVRVTVTGLSLEKADGTSFYHGLGTFDVSTLDAATYKAGGGSWQANEWYCLWVEASTSGGALTYLWHENLGNQPATGGPFFRYLGVFRNENAGANIDIKQQFVTGGISWGLTTNILIGGTATTRTSIGLDGSDLPLSINGVRRCTEGRFMIELFAASGATVSEVLLRQDFGGSSTFGAKAHESGLGFNTLFLPVEPNEESLTYILFPPGTSVNIRLWGWRNLYGRLE